MIASERETTVTVTDADDLVSIYACQRKVITKLRKHQAFTEIASGEFEGAPWACFTIPADQWNPATGAKRRSNLSDEQRAALADRMRAMHEKED